MRSFTLLAVGLIAAASPAIALPGVAAISEDSAGREASVKVAVVADTDATLQGWTQAGGVRAYGLIVPPGGKVSVRLRHAKAGYFHIGRKWMHNLGYTPDKCLSGDPMNCFNNATDKPIDVYFVVSEDGHWADEKSPYTLEFTRSWKHGFDAGGVKVREQIEP